MLISAKDSQVSPGPVTLLHSSIGCEMISVSTVIIDHVLACQAIGQRKETFHLAPSKQLSQNDLRLSVKNRLQTHQGRLVECKIVIPQRRKGAISATSA